MLVASTFEKTASVAMAMVCRNRLLLITYRTKQAKNLSLLETIDGGDGNSFREAVLGMQM